MIEKPQTLLGFDFGMKRIGVAVGQTLTKSAKPLPILNARDGVPRWESIQELISFWSITALVVGIPYNMGGSDQPITHLAAKFANKLRGRFSLPVYTVDERLTTREARRLYYENVPPSKQKTTPLWDSYAAVLILEQWLKQEPPYDP